MQDLTHIKTLDSSLTKIVKNATYTGELNIANLYLLNTINNILYNSCLELNHEQTSGLKEIYTKLTFRNPEICKGSALEDTLLKKSSNFTTCYEDTDSVITDLNVYYWKSGITESNNTIINSITEEFLETVESTERSLLSQGFTLTSQTIGKLVILYRNYPNANFTVYDTLNNNVTSAFTTYSIPNLNSTLLISNEVYTNDDLRLKILTNG